MKRGVATVGLLVAVWACLACGYAAPGQSTQDRFLDSNGVRIRFHVLGQGPPVVLIHGFGESLESWHQRGVVRALSPHFKVIAMDVRGHGHSSKSHDPKSYGTELSGDVVRLLRHLGATKAHVVGYSMGASWPWILRFFIRSKPYPSCSGALAGTRQKPSRGSGSRQRRSKKERSPCARATTRRRWQPCCEGCAC